MKKKQIILGYIILEASSKILNNFKNPEIENIRLYTLNTLTW